MLKDHYEGDINAMLAAGTAEANIDNILTLDQVTRNIYKGTAKMYSGDALAQKLTKQLLPNILTMPAYEAAFCLMALMHSESVADHDVVTKLFADLH